MKGLLRSSPFKIPNTTEPIEGEAGVRDSYTNQLQRRMYVRYTINPDGTITGVDGWLDETTDNTHDYQNDTNDSHTSSHTSGTYSNAGFTGGQWSTNYHLGLHGEDITTYKNLSDDSKAAFTAGYVDARDEAGGHYGAFRQRMREHIRKIVNTDPRYKNLSPEEKERVARRLLHFAERYRDLESKGKAKRIPSPPTPEEQRLLMARRQHALELIVKGINGAIDGFNGVLDFRHKLSNIAVKAVRETIHVAIDVLDAAADSWQKQKRYEADKAKSDKLIASGQTQEKPDKFLGLDWDWEAFRKGYHAGGVTVASAMTLGVSDFVYDKDKAWEETGLKGTWTQWWTEFFAARGADAAHFAIGMKFAQANLARTTASTADQAKKLSLVGCFVAGTPVATENGLRPIDEIVKGDRVWSCHRTTGEWCLCVVEEAFSNKYAGTELAISIAGEWIRSSVHHPYWVVEGDDLDSRPKPEHVSAAMAEGSSLPGRWVDATDLRVGDVLFLRDGRRLPIESIETTMLTERVYNIAVELEHNYAVGNSGILVHNSCSENVNKVIEAGEAAKSFLGKDYKILFNASGDKIFISKDGLRKIRFDFINSHGDFPHIHLEVFVNGRWRDAIRGLHRLYPTP